MVEWPVFDGLQGSCDAVLLTESIGGCLLSRDVGWWFAAVMTLGAYFERSLDDERFEKFG
jgi:hypothetical protein